MAGFATRGGFAEGGRNFEVRGCWAFSFMCFASGGLLVATTRFPVKILWYATETQEAKYCLAMPSECLVGLFSLEIMLLRHSDFCSILELIW